MNKMVKYFLGWWWWWGVQSGWLRRHEALPDAALFGLAGRLHSDPPRRRRAPPSPPPLRRTVPCDLDHHIDQRIELK